MNRVSMVVVVLVIVGAFFAGRATVDPVHTVEYEQVIEYQDRIVEVEKIVEKIVEVEKTKWKTKETIRYVDGTVVEREAEGEGDRTVNKDVQKEIEVVSEVKYVDREVTRELKANWSVGVTYDLASTLKDPTHPWNLGIQVDRRIIGPVFLGGWVNTDADAGMAIRLEF